LAFPTWSLPANGRERHECVIPAGNAACLILEYAVRNARRYGAVLGFSGGLIGSPGTGWDFPGSLGCDENDFYIPRE
jgi:hypothetical protein